ncbi:NADP oxidoreductase [Knoellia sinensis KCTC 19936]|uniref:NADP oxidoreductase n=1 Tax=Knoellia sinensis KCTC 19936 TaxID=1385520 RepID=A0A0A0J638_9MICO|nr:NAD(P)-binding domain-containing protein [Knoellia sinensis]KGN31041.1 NADP oxidoreductase [Knoellia sinensis KCTC 19936]
MKIAVLGTGMVGRAIATRLAELAHDVTVGTRDPEVTRERDAEWFDANTAVSLATFADAATGAELVVNATNGGATLEVLEAAGSDALAGKVLVDISNPLDFSAGMPPTLFVKDSDSLAEQIQRAYPDARVVKTLNTLTADLMVDPDRLSEDSSVFVSGNDAEAKSLVTDLLRSFGHADVIDLGDIATARGPEMWLPLWLRLWGALGSAEFNLKVVR